jgi:hypothetical protein
MIDQIDFRPVILAGGSGTRFWPRSRRAHAKQVLALDGERSMIQQTVERLKPLAGLEKEFPGCLGYRVQLRGRMSEAAAGKCALPAIAAPGQTVSFSTTDEGASIYYTTDGSFPGPGNATGTAQVYTGPFEAGAGTVVRWAGYLEGLMGSDAGQAVIT